MRYYESPVGSEADVSDDDAWLPSPACTRKKRARVSGIKDSCMSLPMSTPVVMEEQPPLMMAVRLPVEEVLPKKAAVVSKESPLSSPVLLPAEVSNDPSVSGQSSEKQICKYAWRRQLSHVLPYDQASARASYLAKKRALFGIK